MILDDVVAVDYAQQALTTFNNSLANVDFSVFMTMLAAVITATIGVRIGMIALRKGYSTLIRFLRSL